MQEEICKGKVVINNIPISNLENYIEILHKTANVIILSLDKQSNILYVNSYIEHLTGYKSEEILGKNWIEVFIPTSNGVEIENIFQDVIESKDMHWGNINEIVCKDGSIKTISWNNSLCLDANGVFETIISIGNDITQFRKVENQLKETIEDLKEEHQKQQFLFSRLSNIVIETDGIKIVNASESLMDFFGYDDLEAFKSEYNCVCEKFVQHEDYFHIGMIDKDENWIEVMKKLPKAKQVVVMIDKDYETHAFSVRFSPTFHKKFLIYFDDVTDLMIQTKEYEYKANHDSLTKIFNREKFNSVYKKLQITDNPNSLLMFDIDYFKKVNDKYGHDVGDKVLKALSDCVKEEISSKGVFSRWGGEEFMVLLFENQDKAYDLAENIRNKVKSLNIKGIPQITISLGVTQIRGDKDKNEALKRVDKALYDAKGNGRNRTVRL